MIDGETLGYWRYRAREKLKAWVASKLPRWLVAAACIRVAAWATHAQWENQIVPNLRLLDALKRWDTPHIVREDGEPVRHFDPVAAGVATAGPVAVRERPVAALDLAVRAALRQAVWEASQHVDLADIREYVDGVIDEIASDEL